MSNDMDEPVILITVKLNPTREVAYIKSTYTIILNGKQSTSDIEENLSVPFNKVVEEIGKTIDNVISFYREELNV